MFYSIHQATEQPRIGSEYFPLSAKHNESAKSPNDYKILVIRVFLISLFYSVPEYHSLTLKQST